MTRFDVLVEGRSLPALAAALDLAELGLRVLVAGEAAVGGAFAVPERDAEGAIADLLRRVSEPLPGAHAAEESSNSAALRPRHAVPVLPLLRDGADTWQPQPEPNVWGIPALPADPRIAALIGGGGAFRAYRDRIAPLLTVGKTRSLGELIRKRMGRAVLSQLSEPLIRERYGVAAEAVDVAIAAPGLNEALTRAGSLSTAASTYFDRHVERETELMPEGGWTALEAALARRLALYGVEFSPSSVLQVQPGGEQEWTVLLEDGERHDVRAVVLERSAEFAPLQPMRAHAGIDIETPSGLEAGQCGLLQHGEWTLRLHGDGRAEARGPRVEPGAQPDIVEGGDPLDALLAAAGVRARAGAAWRIEHRAAPYATVEERDSAAEALDALVHRAPTSLAVGRALHGDDLSAALLAAHRGAVALRRRLLGIAEGG